MSAKVGFFNPSDEFSLAGWEVQNNSPSKSSDRAQTLNKDGDECASNTHNTREEQTITYKQCGAGELTLPVVGLVNATGWHIDSMSVSLSNTDWAELSISAHKHSDGSSHTTGSCRTYTPTLTIETAGMGILRTGLGEFALGGSDTGVGITSVTYELSVTHVDELGDAGNWIAGENRDGVEKFTITTVGTGATITKPSGWDEISTSISKDNTNADNETFEFEHHIKMDEEGITGGGGTQQMSAPAGGGKGTTGTTGGKTTQEEK